MGSVLAFFQAGRAMILTEGDGEKEREVSQGLQGCHLLSCQKMALSMATFFFVG